MKHLLLSIPLVFSFSACAAENAKPETVASAQDVRNSVIGESSKVAQDLRPLLEGQKMARCIIGPNKYEGPCVFRADKNGSFSISRRDQSTLFSNVSVVSVSIVETGKAEVRGLTTEGVNSRWGMATRSEDDRACWSGADFEVCAY